MSQPPSETSEAVPLPVVEDPGRAWEERRKAWLKPNDKGQRRATQTTIDRLQKVLNAEDEDETQKAAAQRSKLFRRGDAGFTCSIIWLTSDVCCSHSGNKSSPG